LVINFNVNGIHPRLSRSKPGGLAGTMSEGEEMSMRRCSTGDREEYYAQTDSDQPVEQPRYCS